MKAKGQKQLVDACPYGHIWWNEAEDVPQAWPFDAHLLDQGWQQTRGQQSCPTGAMRAVKLEDAEMERLARRGARGDAARARHQAARLLPQPVALHDLLHRRHGLGRGGRHRRLRRGRARAAHEGRRRRRRSHERQLRRLQVRPPARRLRPLHVEIEAPGRATTVAARSARASISARSGSSYSAGASAATRPTGCARTAKR